jgi:hypothetical protein
MKTIYLIFPLYFFAFYLNAQNRIIIPKQGKMVFKEEIIVVNSQKLDSSLFVKKPMILAMMRDFFIGQSNKENLKANITKFDSTIEASIKPALDFMLDPRKTIKPAILYTYVFEDTIIKVQILNSPLEKNREITVINAKNGQLSFFDLKDTVWVKNDYKFGLLKQDSNKNLMIKEYRNIRKNILGYDCFKIVVTKNGSPFNGQGMFDNVPPEFKEKYKQILEPLTEQVFYVTERINCKYNPSTNLSEVLNKYYPLEIITKEGLVEGVEKRYTLKEISIE